MDEHPICHAGDDSVLDRSRLCHSSKHGFWIDRDWHLLLIGCQILGLLGYLIYVLRWFVRISPVISGTRAEWREDVEHLQS
jgi:hypothetical protein